MSGEEEAKKRKRIIPYRLSEEGINKMNKPLSEKEKLLSMLTDIYDQLEELESVLEASFSDLRISLNKDEQIKISDTSKKILFTESKIDHVNLTFFENSLEPNQKHTSKRLELELGF